MQPTKKFSTTWKQSTQPRKQRAYRFRAPLHVQQKLMGVHLSPDLRKKYKKRNVTIRKGDKVRILRGQFSKKEGKVDRVDLRKNRVFVEQINLIKKDGTKIPFPLRPSQLLLVEVQQSQGRKTLEISS